VTIIEELKVISVSEAERIISENIKVFPTVQRPLEDGCGAILREDIFADRDQPAFPKVLMDGIAVSYASWKKGIRRFKIEAIQPAGGKPTALKKKDHCMEVMTGAILPKGADCVIPIEEVTVHQKDAVVRDGLKPSRMQNILPQASDYRKGDLLLEAGRSLLPPQIALLAAVGKAQVKVSLNPKAAIVSTGDELVEVAARPRVYQTRISNVYALQAALAQNGFENSARFHLFDDRRQLRKRLSRFLKTFDILILSGGVSMGKFDFVPGVLKEIGVQVLFHKVQQKPGKPFWFGVDPHKKPVFALPGNPASTQVCFYRYVLPYLKKALGMRPDSQELVCLVQEVSVSRDLTHFLPVTLKDSFDGKRRVRLVAASGSGDYRALAQSNGFIELKSVEGYFPAETVVPFYRW